MILFGEDREAWDRTEAELRDALDVLVAAGEVRALVPDLLHLAFLESSPRWRAAGATAGPKRPPCGGAERPPAVPVPEILALRRKSGR